MLRGHPVARSVCGRARYYHPGSLQSFAPHVYQKIPTLDNRTPALEEETLGWDGGGDI